MHELSEHTRHAFDMLAWLLAGVAAVGLANAAMVITILAASASFILAVIRIYDRVKHGHSQ